MGYYFTELIIKGFGVHIDKKFQFTPGLNAIVGESEAGKTTIIRALYLLLENQPRKGEELYQSWLTNESLSIELKDNRGNSIKRKNNKYYFNGGKPLKAFGASVPEPIRQLFAFKEINWQRQLDPHFLLFNTGGSSARLLNDATGMGDQEKIVAEVKNRLTQSKSEIKRLKKNNAEYKITIERLKNITRFRLKAEAILNLQSELIEDIKKFNRLEEILIHLDLIKEKKDKYKKGEKYMDEFEKILKDKSEIEEFEEYTNLLNSILNDLKNLKIYDQTQLEKYLNSLQRVERLNSENNLMKLQIKKLEKLIMDIAESEEKQKYMIKEIKKHKKEIQLVFNELGYCPLCGRKINDGNSCCG